MKWKTFITISIFTILTTFSLILHKNYQPNSNFQQMNDVNRIQTLGENDIEVLSKETFKPREYIKIR